MSLRALKKDDNDEEKKDGRKTGAQKARRKTRDMCMDAHRDGKKPSFRKPIKNVIAVLGTHAGSRSAGIRPAASTACTA